MFVNTVEVNNSKLNVGEYYWFKIIKTLDLGNKKKYYVLEDPPGYKILLPKDFYIDYGFKPGEKVLCRVDKINCKGQMFIEPMHPHYKEENVYSFKYIESKESINFFDEKEYIIIVSDLFDNKWEVKTAPGNHIVNSSEVKCYVEKIKKGMLFLRKADENMAAHMLKPGKYYEFLIVDEKTNPQNRRRYFILEDKNKNKHLLQKKHYLNYRLKKGQKVICRVDRLSSEGYYYLEPLHPYYKIGEKYSFPVKRMDHNIFSNDKHQYVLVLEDIYGEELAIDLGESMDGIQTDIEHIECKVTEIHKGQPVLDITK